VIDLTNGLLREFLRREGHRPADGKLHIVGLRGADRRGPRTIERNANEHDRYNDTLCVFGTALECFRATVDPGATWTRNPSNPRGAAHLINGRWFYQWGTHRGRRALVQAAPVTVRRDRDRDGEDEGGEPLDTGWFGVNVHPGGTAPTVGAWSAGCQVLWGGWSGQPWRRFVQLLEASKQSCFDYYLVDASGLLRRPWKRPVEGSRPFSAGVVSASSTDQPRSLIRLRSVPTLILTWRAHSGSVFAWP
jgi:hypothetical protein